MRTVEVSRRIPATPTEIRHHVDPARLIELEGTFRVVDVSEDESGETTVTARGGGMEVEFRFAETEHGYRYEQAGEAGPFETMETEFELRPKDEGSIVRLTSAVSLGLPIDAISDRIAAWKRRGELKRALKELASDLG
jgi:hypothetical protein